ncbi:MAG: hypothetical protein R8M45_09355 [Ghiorsea sp.]
MRSSMVFFMGVGLCFPAWASASEDWSSSAVLQSSYTLYADSDKRNSAVSAGVLMAADYLDGVGFSLAGNVLKLDMASGDPITQKSLFASGRYPYYADSLGGKLTFRLDAHSLDLSNDLLYQETVKSIAPSLAFLNYSKRFYVDMGYAYSMYDNNNLTVQQFSPTVGFSFNQDADWLQSRIYAVRPSSANLDQGVANTLALEMKWTHALAPNFGLERMFVSTLLGERVYAVDGDAAAVYSLSDVQQGGFSAGVQGAWFDGVKSTLLVGYDAYLNQSTNDAYTSQYVYLALSKSW